MGRGLIYGRRVLEDQVSSCSLKQRNDAFAVLRSHAGLICSIALLSMLCEGLPNSQYWVLSTLSRSRTQREECLNHLKALGERKRCSHTNLVAVTVAAIV